MTKMVLQSKICSMLMFLLLCFVCTTAKNIFWKRHLKIATVFEAPFAFNNGNQENAPDQENAPIVGFIPDLLDLLFKDLNVTYDLYVPVSNVKGKFGKILNEVTEGKADMAVAPLTVTPERSKLVKFSFPYMPANIVPAIQRPKNPGQKFPFRHIKELALLAQTKKLQYGILKGGATEAMLRESTYKLYQEIYQQLKKQERQGLPALVDNYTVGLQHVKNNSNYVFIGDESFLEYASGRHPCDTMVWGKPLNTAFYSLAFSNRVPSKFFQYVNQRLLKVQRFGKIRRLKDKWWEYECQKPKMCICSARKCAKNEPENQSDTA